MPLFWLKGRVNKEIWLDGKKIGKLEVKGTLDWRKHAKLSQYGIQESKKVCQ